VAARADDQPADEASSAHYTLLGPATCSQWPKSGSISSAAKAVPLNWALGYLGAAAGDDKLGLLDLATPEAVDSFLTSYCKDHPTENLPLAVKVLTQQLEAKLPQSAQASAAREPPMFVPPTKVAANPAKETTTAARASPAKKKKAKQPAKATK
jgi:hypothetical protein